jgi:hypothetical protein
MNLSTADPRNYWTEFHETWWSYRYMFLVGSKVFSFVVKAIREIMIYPHIKFWWYRTMLNFCGIVVAILKMATGRNFSMSGINSGRWNRTMLNLCGIVAAILNMATGRNFSMSGIISAGRHFQNVHHHTAQI